MSDEEPIRIQIMDSEYRIACSEDERDALLKAAAHLNDTMQGIRSTGKVLGVERIAVMAALNISYELLDTQRQNAILEEAVNERLKEILGQVEKALGKTASTAL